MSGGSRETREEKHSRESEYAPLGGRVLGEGKKNSAAADVKLMLRALKLMLNYKTALALFLVASISYGLIYGAFLFLLKEYLGIIFHQRDMGQIVRWAEMIALLGVGIAVAAYYREITNFFISTRVQVDIFRSLFANILRQSMSRFDKISTGQTISTTLRDVSSIPSVNNELLRVVREPLVILPILIQVLGESWKLTVASLIVIPLMLWPLTVLGRKIKKAMAKTRLAFGQLSDIILQTMNGIRIVKAYRSEDRVLEGFCRVNDRIFSQTMKNRRAMAMTRGVVELITTLGIVAVIIAGGYLLINQKLKVDSVVMLVLAVNMMYRPIKNMSNSYNRLQQQRSGLQRAFGILDAEPAITDAPDAVELGEFSDTIVFDKVCFSYAADNPVLKDMSFTVKKGESVGIVGPTGVGKSTIVNLVMRFYEVASGRVLVDGVDIRKVKIASLMDNIALVTQTPFLFNTSVYENILYGRPDAAEEEVHAAAKAANIHDEILHLPAGYETLCGEWGESLSGGQRQRIAIARAVLSSAPVFLLDEATSALDSASEKLVQAALDRLRENHTALIVAHRLSTLTDCDRILVLKNGEMEAFAPHSELLEISPTYRLLWETQVGGSTA